MSPARCVQATAQKHTEDLRPDAYWSIVSDLVSLIDRTRGYQLVNEAPRQAEPDNSNVIVLDDIAPAQSRETVLLSDCNLRLREALHILLEARSSYKRTQSAASGDRENATFDSCGALARGP